MIYVTTSSLCVFIDSILTSIQGSHTIFILNFAEEKSEARSGDITHAR